MAATEPLPDTIVIERPSAAVALLEERTDPLIAKADAYQIDSDSVYQSAASFLRDLKALQKEVTTELEPSISAANTAHKTLTALRSKLLGPLKDAEALVKRKMAGFIEAQERAAAEERRRLEAEARKAEEDRRLREAEALEAEGKTEAAEEALSRPVVTPSVRQAVPTKAKGVSTRKVYSAEVVDLAALVKAVSEGRAPIGLLLPNQTALDGMASSMKEAFLGAVPGVDLKTETVVAARGR